MKKLTPLLFLACATTASAVPPTRPAVVHAHALPGKSGAEPWDGLQFIQADRNGRAFLLRVATLQVYPVSRRDGLGSAEKLTPAPSLSDGAMILDAAMGNSSDDWLLLSGLNRVRKFVGGEERLLPRPEWQVSAVAWPSRGATLAVLPIEILDTERRVDVATDAPVLLREGDGSWETLSHEPFTLDAKGPAALQSLRWRTETRAAAGSKGSLWIANTTAYRARRFDPVGAKVDELLVGDGRTKFVDRPRKEVEAIVEDLATQGIRLDPSRISPQRGVRVVAGLTCAPDGRLYVVVEVEDATRSASGLALDRYDPERGALERVALADLEGSRFSLAPAKDGLFIVSADASAGRWYLDWDELDNARWTNVADARLNGEPLPKP